MPDASLTPAGGQRRRQFTASLPMRTALLAVAAVWFLGAVWSYTEQSAFAANKGFAYPHLLPLVIDGFAIAMAGVAWAASLDARPAVAARLATVVAVCASSASNGAWAWIRSNHDAVAVLLGVAVPVAANLAFEVLLAELRRQVQRRRGLPPPVAIPYPRLIRLVLAPWRSFVEWRTMVLDLTAMEHATSARPSSTPAAHPAAEPTPAYPAADAPTVAATALRGASPGSAAATAAAPGSAPAAGASPNGARAAGTSPGTGPAVATAPGASTAAGSPGSPPPTPGPDAPPPGSTPTNGSGRAIAPAGRTAAEPPPVVLREPTPRPARPSRTGSATRRSATTNSTTTNGTATNGTGSRSVGRSVDPRVEMLAMHLAAAEDGGEFTGEMVGPLLGVEMAPRTGRRLLGQARELVAERARAEDERRDAGLRVIGAG